MTLDELRALCATPGWSVRRVALLLGRSDATIHNWLRGEELPPVAADWLARVTVRPTKTGGILTVTVPPKQKPGRKPKEA